MNRALSTFVAVLAIAALAATGAAEAAAKKASPCKGLDQNACAANAECTWIKPKKGKEYCRKAPAKKAPAPAAEPAKPKS